MRTILAYGDSLTWGADPGQGMRLPWQDRWTTVLEEELNKTGPCRVICEGLHGRTTSFDDPAAAIDRNGANWLPICLASHRPLDLVILMLGTNDLKPSIAGTAAAAADGMARLAGIVRQSAAGPDGAPPLLIVAPPPLCASALPGGKPAKGRSIAESRLLAPLYQAVAKSNRARFFDAGTVCMASSVDGVHMDGSAHISLGMAMLGEIRRWRDHGCLNWQPLSL